MGRLSGVTTAVIISLTAWPFLWIFSEFPLLTKPVVLAPTGCLSLGLIAFLLRWLLPPDTNISKSQNPNVYGRGFLYYTCCLFSFSCVIDGIFYLEKIGQVEGLMSFYLETGEPYFKTSYGTLSLLWDQTGNLLLYLIIIYQIDNHLDCRNTIIYWGGTMVVSIFTLLIGAASGHYGSEMLPASLLNIPYVVLPIHYLVKFMLLPRHFEVRSSPPRFSHREESFIISVLDLSLLLGLLITTLFGLVRGLAGLDSPFPLAKAYSEQFEPYILEPSKFGNVWVLFLMTIGSFIQIVMMHGLFIKNAKWMIDWSLLYLSMTIYGTYVHLSPQFCPGVQPQYYIPADQQTLVVLLNLMIPVVACGVFIRSYTRYAAKDDASSRKAD